MPSSVTFVRNTCCGEIEVQQGYTYCGYERENGKVKIVILALLRLRIKYFP
jgi:hypothetical protein